MKRHLHRKMRIWLCSLVCGLWAMPLLANRSALPDSLITEDKVYEFTFSDTPLAERIMMELRKKGKQATHELDITEGDLYYNTGRFIIAASFYKNALAAKAVKRDEQMTMKLLHRLISCYDGLYDEKRKAETVKLLMQNAQEAGDSGMESIALFYLGKSLHEQGTKERGYVYMLYECRHLPRSPPAKTGLRPSSADMLHSQQTSQNRASIHPETHHRGSEKHTRHWYPV